VVGGLNLADFCLVFLLVLAEKKSKKMKNVNSNFYSTPLEIQLLTNGIETFVRFFYEFKKFQILSTDKIFTENSERFDETKKAA
jgi:hypothetical protein